MNYPMVFTCSTDMLILFELWFLVAEVGIWKEILRTLLFEPFFFLVVLLSELILVGSRLG